jgi:hypothetical protein
MSRQAAERKTRQKPAEIVPSLPRIEKRFYMADELGYDERHSHV